MKVDKVDWYLRKLGIRENLSGTDMLRRAIGQWRPGCKITKDIYPDVARYFFSTPGRVERCMRHAIETGMERCDPEVVEHLFGGTIDPERGKPTNAEFIATLARECVE